MKHEVDAVLANELQSKLIAELVNPEANLRLTKFLVRNYGEITRGVLAGNLITGVFAGPESAHWQQRLELMTSWESDSEVSFSNWARGLSASFQARIREARVYEEENF
jgi:hypothetical protein